MGRKDYLSKYTKDDGLVDVLSTENNRQYLEHLIYRNYHKFKESKDDYKNIKYHPPLDSALKSIAKEVDNFYPDCKIGLPSVYDYSFFNGSGLITRSYAKLPITLFAISALAFTAGVAVNPLIGISTGIFAFGAGIFYAGAAWENHKKSKASSRYMYNMIAIGESNLNVYDIYPILAHEYTHHLQKLNGVSQFRRNMGLEEGQARLTERYIADNFEKLHKTKGYRHFTYSLISYELRMAYKYLSDKFGKTPSKAIMDLDINLGIYNRTQPNMYDIGTSIFSILDEQHGSVILEDTMKKDYSKILKLNSSFDRPEVFGL